MIDWFFVLSNAVWVSGCMLALAVLSIANYQALAAHSRLRDRLKHPSIQAALSLAGVLFCAGMAASTEAVWERLLWAALAIGFVAQVFLLRRASL